MWGIKLQNRGEVEGVILLLIFMRHKFIVLAVKMVKIGVHLRKNRGTGFLDHSGLDK